MGINLALLGRFRTGSKPEPAWRILHLTDVQCAITTQMIVEISDAAAEIDAAIAAPADIAHFSRTQSMLFRLRQSARCVASAEAICASIACKAIFARRTSSRSAAACPVRFSSNSKARFSLPQSSKKPYTAPPRADKKDALSELTDVPCQRQTLCFRSARKRARTLSEEWERLRA